LICSLVFAVAAAVAVFTVTSTIQGSRARIVDAFQGRPLPRVRPGLRAAA
jgi:hypothetical protein